MPGLNKHLADPSPPKELPTRDRFTDTVSTDKTVEQMHASPNHDQNSCRPVQAQDLAAFGTDQYGSYYEGHVQFCQFYSRSGCPLEELAAMMRYMGNPVSLNYPIWGSF